MTIEVIRPGLLTTIQDGGRRNYQKYGVTVSGPMDEDSFKLANLLVGNYLNEAALEMTVIGPTLYFHEDAMISICGAPFQATIDGIEVPMYRPVSVKKGATLTFNHPLQGVRAYLAVRGGIRTKQVLNSRATFERGKIGGITGEKLKSGDLIPVSYERLPKQLFTVHDNFFSTTKWFIEDAFLLNNPSTIRVIEGRQYHLFTEKSKQLFWTSKYQISIDADRMGFRLTGQPLKLKNAFELISEGTTFGTIQVPSDGQPIVLMADRQTTGGYPKIGHVISVDLRKLAQLPLLHSLTFEKTTLEEAQRLLIEKQQFLRRMAMVLKNELRS